MSSSTSAPETVAPPSQLSAQIKQAKGAIYQTIGNNISSDPTWKTEGEALSTEGAKEGEEASAIQKGEAGWERLGGKAQSAYGAVMGDKEQLNKGNVKAEKAEWKEAAADGTIPSVSTERMKGKLESGLGMLTGDVEKQTNGNMRAEKAEWTGQ